MNNHGFFAAYSGMLNAATRREASDLAAHPRRRRMASLARLFGRA